jgi:preprotein translocase subunit SecG
MDYLIAIVLILASILLIVVVMVQNSKGGGLDQSFGVTNQLGGASQSTETIEKVTWYLAGGIAALCLISVMFLSNGNSNNGNLKTGIESGAANTEVTTPNALPTGPTPPQ